MNQIMKIVKFKAFLFPKPYANREHPIFIRIYLNRKSSYVSIGYSIPLGAWNSKNSELWESIPTLTKKMKESYSSDQKKELRKLQASIILLPNAYKINSEIRTKIGKLEEILNKLSANQEAISLEILKRQFENTDQLESSKKDFFLFIEEVIKRKYEGKQIRTSEKYSVMLKKLKSFWKKKTLPITELTTSFLNDFQLYLKKEGCHINYIHVNLKALRTIIQKDAIKENKLLSPDKNPFIWFTMPIILPTRKEKLDIIEIGRMEELKLDNNDFLFHVRNAFIFSLYNAGIRIGDLLQLKWGNISETGRLEYFMGKTGKQRSIKLLPQATEILKLYESSKEKETDYIFPFLNNHAEYSKLSSPEDFQKASPELLTILYNQIESKIAKYNYALKKIATKSKIKKNISSHIARHSFANIARKKVSVYDIKNMLGQSSIKVAEAYLESLDYDAMDQAMNEVFN
jgi:integrase